MLRVEKFLGCLELQTGGLFIAGLSMASSLLASISIIMNCVLYDGEKLKLYG